MELNLTPHGHLEIAAAVTGPIETNTYIVRSGDEIAVIDPAWDGEALAAHIAQAYPGSRVRLLICTHGHADHVGGVAGLRRALGGDVSYLLPRDDVPMVEANIAHQREAWGIETEDPGEPDRLLVDGDTIDLGDVTFQVMATPGHTPGGVVLIAATEDGNIAFVGDTLFPGSHGRTDLAGGDEAAILRSLHRMGSTLPPDTLCLIGHGGATTIERELATNPFMQGCAQ